MPPGPHEGLLRHVLGPTTVTDDGERAPEDHPLEAAHEGEHRIPVARRDTCHQRLIGHFPHVGSTTAGAEGIARARNPSPAALRIAPRAQDPDSARCDGDGRSRLRRRLQHDDVRQQLSGGNSSGGNANQPVSLPGTTNDKGTKSPTGNEIEVELDDFYFSPTFIQGTPGQALTLHLKNEGKNTHTFTSTALNVDQTLQPGSGHGRAGHAAPDRRDRVPLQLPPEPRHAGRVLLHGRRRRRRIGGAGAGASTSFESPARRFVERRLRLQLTRPRAPGRAPHVVGLDPGRCSVPTAR